jgi:polyisoprenoid-binding protein YceI
VRSGTASAEAWRLDPTRASVEFHTGHFDGLMTANGRFGCYHGTLDRRSEPAV